MKELDVKCTVTSGDDEIIINATGDLTNNRLSFQDDEQIKHFIILEKNKMKYIRQGSVDMKYEFQENIITQGSYQTLGKKLLFDIKTLTLEKKKDKLFVHYQLLQDKTVVNDATINIEYREI
ncbi:MAG: DUF1934 family protein [Candidatus Izemoplasma sp.]|nr:DUF1934 family protein [Candidatus Izemoplasma sp.]